MYPRIRDLREDHDLRQRELVAYLNCSQQVYSNYELRYMSDFAGLSVPILKNPFSCGL